MQQIIICVLSTVPRILISIKEGCFKGYKVSRERITAQGGGTEVDYGDKGDVTFMGTPLKSITPPHSCIYMWAGSSLLQLMMV